MLSHKGYKNDFANLYCCPVLSVIQFSRLTKTHTYIYIWFFWNSKVSSIFGWLCSSCCFTNAWVHVILIMSTRWHCNIIFILEPPSHFHCCCSQLQLGHTGMPLEAAGCSEGDCWRVCSQEFWKNLRAELIKLLI